MKRRFVALALVLPMLFAVLSAQALTWNGGASGNWNAYSYNWLDDSGQSAVWMDGLSATFAESADVDVAASISAASLTFRGSEVSLASHAEVLTYSMTFLQTDRVVLFRNASLASVSSISGLMADGKDHNTYVKGQQPLTAYRIANDGQTLTAQLQHFSIEEHYTKCVCIELTQQGADIAGRALWASYFNGKDINKLGEDLSLEGLGSEAPLSTGTNNGYGVESLTVSFCGGSLTLVSPAVLAAENGAIASISLPLGVSAVPEYADGASSLYAPFLPKNAPVKVLENARLDDIKRLRGKHGGTYITTYNRHGTLYADSYNARRLDANTLSLQLQSWSDLETYTKCVVVELSQVGNDIYARAKSAYALLPQYTNGLGHDFESGNPNNSPVDVAESGTANGYGIYDLEIILKGELEEIPQALTVNGDSVRRFAGFLPGESTKLFENLSLDDVVCLGAKLGGMYIDSYYCDHKILHATPYHLTRDGNTLTMQLQGYAARDKLTKVVVVELSQVGADIYGRALKAYCYETQYQDVRGIDFENHSGVIEGSLAFSENGKGYGVYDLCLVNANADRVVVKEPIAQQGDLVVKGTLELNENASFNGLVCVGAVRNDGLLVLRDSAKNVFQGQISGEGAVAIDGTDVDFLGTASYTGGLIVRNGHVRLYENRALPETGPIEVGAGGNLVLCPNGAPGDSGYAYNVETASMGGTNPVFVTKGGTLTLGESDRQAWFVTGIRGGRRFVLDGGTIDAKTKWRHLDSYYNQNYLANIEMKNASSIVGTRFLAGYYQGMEICSSGEGTNTVSSGFWMVKTDPSDPPVSLNVLDGTLNVSGEIGDHPEYKGHNLNKDGEGLLLLGHANTYIGDTIVKAGTLRVTADGALPPESDIVLAGGTLDAGKVTNGCATLAVTANSVLNVEGCDLSFADSSAVVWADGAVLTLTGDLRHSKVRFGTNASGLTAAQLAAIRYENHPVVIDAEGYVRRNVGLVIVVK